jgi:hypothetical protein
MLVFGTAWRQGRKSHHARPTGLTAGCDPQPVEPCREHQPPAPPRAEWVRRPSQRKRKRAQAATARVTEADGVDDRQVHLDRDCEGTPRFPLVVDFEEPPYAITTSSPGLPSSTELSLGIPAASQTEVDELLPEAQSRRRDADRTSPHAPVRCLLRLLRRS